MPAGVFGENYRFLPRKDVLRFEEIERLVQLIVKQGARKLRITGGEPLVRAELPTLLRALARIPNVEDLALTTNGYLLSEQAKDLKAAGLQRLTISLDSLDSDTFAKLNGRGYALQRVLQGIQSAENAGYRQIKINAVIQRGVNEPDVLALAEYFRGTGHILRFIEFMDVGTMNDWKPRDVVGGDEILHTLSEHWPLEPIDPNYRGEVATRYQYADGAGEIGLIRSVTAPFCGDCTRARLSADGRLVTCLFAQSGLDLKTPLRDGISDAKLEAMLRGFWSERHDRYSEERASLHEERLKSGRIEMFEIGG